VPMHSPVQLLSKSKGSISLMLSCFILVLLSRNAFALTSSDTLSDKSRLILKNAQQHILKNKYQRAFDLSSDVLEDNPRQYEAQFINAQALAHLGKSNEAIELYKLMLKTNPNQPEIYNNLANLYAQQGELDLARQTLEKGIATNEQYKTLYENLSAIYVEIARGSYSKALKLGVEPKAVQLKTLKIASIASEPRSKPISVAKKIDTKISATKPGTVKSSVATTEKTQIAMVKKEVKKLPVKAPPIKTIKPKVAEKPIARQKPILATRSKQKPKINKEEVITALQGWAAAWSAQAVDLYLSFYGEDFKPVKLSKKVWAVQRRIRIKKPRWVNVRLANFKVQAKPSKEGFAVVQLVQNYRADNYHDKTKKQFVMKHTMDGWRILSEQSLAVLK